MAAALASGGIEHYLPVRREVHRWSDRRKVVEVLVIPRYVFVRCTPSERLSVLASDPRIRRFLSLQGVPSVVPDSEMETFRRMVEEGPGGVSMSAGTLAPGDRVRVMDGPLTGLECELVSVGGGRCLAVRLGQLGTAVMDLDIQTVEKI